MELCDIGTQAGSMTLPSLIHSFAIEKTLAYSTEYKGHCCLLLQERLERALSRAAGTDPRINKKERRRARTKKARESTMGGWKSVGPYKTIVKEQYLMLGFFESETYVHPTQWLYRLGQRLYCQLEIKAEEDNEKVFERRP